MSQTGRSQGQSTAPNVNPRDGAQLINPGIPNRRPTTAQELARNEEILYALLEKELFWRIQNIFRLRGLDASPESFRVLIRGYIAPLLLTMRKLLWIEVVGIDAAIAAGEINAEEMEEVMMDSMLLVVDKSSADYLDAAIDDWLEGLAFDGFDNLNLDD